MTVKKDISYEQIEDYVNLLIKEIEAKEWKPDLIVGLTRGGLLPAVRLSHKMGIPMQSLQWTTRDHTNRNCHDAALAEDMVDGMKILIVDDICDSGETFKTLIKDMNTSVVDDIAWHEQVRFAALLHKNGSHFHTDFKATTVLDESIWWVFPWEKE